MQRSRLAPARKKFSCFLHNVGTSSLQGDGPCQALAVALQSLAVSFLGCWEQCVKYRPSRDT